MCISILTSPIANIVRGAIPKLSYGIVIAIGNPQDHKTVVANCETSVIQNELGFAL